MNQSERQRRGRRHHGTGRQPEELPSAQRSAKAFHRSWAPAEDRLTIEEPTQVRGEIRGRGITPQRLLCHGLQTDRFEVRGMLRSRLRGGFGSTLMT